MLTSPPDYIQLQLDQRSVFDIRVLVQIDHLDTGSKGQWQFSGLFKTNLTLKHFSTMHAMFVVVVIMIVFVTLLSMTKIKHFCCDLSLHSSTSLGVYSEVQQLLTVLRGLYGLTSTQLVCRLYNADRTRSPPKAVKCNEFGLYSRN